MLDIRLRLFLGNSLLFYLVCINNKLVILKANEVDKFVRDYKIKVCSKSSIPRVTLCNSYMSTNDMYKYFIKDTMQVAQYTECFPEGSFCIPNKPDGYFYNSLVCSI